MSRTSGVRVVLAMFAGCLVIAVAIIGGWTYARPERQPCANGELALNPVIQDGIYDERTDSFDNIEDVEKFICHRVFLPQSQDVELSRISGYRSDTLQNVVEGRGVAEARLEYRHTASGRVIQINTSPQRYAPGPTGTGSETVTINDAAATLTRGVPAPDGVTVDWVIRDLYYRAHSQLGDNFTQADLISVLESIH